jgi:iron-sulfur cluster insertion protein
VPAKRGNNMSDITMTDAAVTRIKNLLENEHDPSLNLRLFIQGGGCSGYSYSFIFDEVINEDDFIITKNDVILLVDAVSAQYLSGAEIDYQESLSDSQFVIKNPNQTSSCGCGKSFSV